MRGETRSELEDAHAVVNVSVEAGAIFACEALVNWGAGTHGGGAHGCGDFAFGKTCGHGNGTAADNLALPQVGEDGIVDAGERVEAHGALLAGSRAGDGVAAKDDGDVTRAVVGGVTRLW